MRRHERERAMVGGAAMTGAALAGLLGMLHHPVAGDAATPAEAVARLGDLAGPAGTVHGVMIAVVLALLIGVVCYAADRGVGRAGVLVGLSLYAVGSVLLLLPAILDGFVLPQVASRAGGNMVAIGVAPDLIRFGLMLAIAVATLSSLLLSAGIMMFGLDQMRDARMPVGGAAGLAGGGAAFLLLATGMRLDAAGMTLVMALWTPWLGATGLWMLRGGAGSSLSRPA